MLKINIKMKDGASIQKLLKIMKKERIRPNESFYLHLIWAYTKSRQFYHVSFSLHLTLL
jgi:hypothetical protein